MTTDHEAPRVLVVDDEPDTVFSQLIDAQGRLSLVIREPDEVYQANLDNVSLILVDYRIDRWPGRDVLETVTLKPLNGLALAGVLRSHTEAAGDRPVAIALHAANLDELAGGLATHSREHLIARLHSLEWAFRKTSDGSGIPKVAQLESLISAVQSLPAAWPDDEPEAVRALAIRLLALPEEGRWVPQALQDFENCHPPIHDLALATHGLAFLRWLLHRILPYPAFLRPVEHLALSLRVTPGSLKQALEKEEDKLINRLEPIRYKGMLDGFLGHRWWKAGIEDLVWTITDGEPFDKGRLADAVRDQLSEGLKPIELRQPVVCVDERLRSTPDLIERSNAVEIQPDDWPAYAQPPWAPLQLARESGAIGALVVEEDRDRMSGEDS